MGAGWVRRLFQGATLSQTVNTSLRGREGHSVPRAHQALEVDPSGVESDCVRLEP